MRRQNCSLRGLLGFPRRVVTVIPPSRGLESGKCYQSLQDVVRYVHTPWPGEKGRRSANRKLFAFDLHYVSLSELLTFEVTKAIPAQLAMQGINSL